MTLAGGVSIFTAVQEQLGLRARRATRSRRRAGDRFRESTERELMRRWTCSSELVLAASAVAATVGPIALSAQIVAPTPGTPIV